MAAHGDILYHEPRRMVEPREFSIQSSLESQRNPYDENKTSMIHANGVSRRYRPSEEPMVTAEISESGDSLTRDDGAGWFHAKIKVENSIKWANNYKLQFCMFLLVCGGVVNTIVFRNTKSISSGLVTGSSLTILACLAVIYSYVKLPSWRKHPNPLIFYRSVCDLFFVIVLLISDISDIARPHGGDCKAAAAFTQLFLFASESWFFVMAIDMLKSLKSPFTDYKLNVKFYHCFVWAAAIISALLLVSIPSAAGISEFDYCWTASSNKNNGVTEFWKLNLTSWYFFYIWLLLYWAYAIGVIIFAWKRLRAGLAETLRMRLRVLHSVTLYVIAIIIYWGLCFCVYAPYLILSTPSQCATNENCDEKWIQQLMIYMITCKGCVVFFVWFQINELIFSDGLFNSFGEKKNDVDVDVDLNPQVNLALRCEVLYYTTTGIIQAVRDTINLPPGCMHQELYLQPQGVENVSTNVFGGDYSLNDELVKPNKQKGTLFLDYCPHTFQTIREHFDISSESYIESLSRTTKERLSEGASGAFMFFSHDQQLIVKSMSADEANFLKSIAADYAAFLLNNPDSLLTRFYGCHAIKLYGSTFYFVVMANLFSTDKVIHRRYDIKGSWVNRSAKHPSNGKRVTCRHCNGSYIFGSTDTEAMNCPNRVGKHEPNTVLKDNDLTTKVRLDSTTSEELYQQLVKDTNFLGRLGIMDYSLLLGVHNVEYVVNDEFFDGEESNRAISRHATTSRSASKYSNYSVHDASLKGAKRRANRGVSASGAKHDVVSITVAESPRGLPRLFTGTRKANTVVGPSFYYFGLIDILQTWDLNKRTERFFKVYFMHKDKHGLSAVPPTEYKERFQRTMGELLGIALHNETSETIHENEVDDQHTDVSQSHSHIQPQPQGSWGSVIVK